MKARRIVLLVSLFLSPICAIAAEPPSQTITAGDNLIIDGIPPIPAELVEQIGRYTESRAATFQDWHPAKPEMLILTRFGDTAQVHRVAMPGGARTQLTFFPDRVNGAALEPTKGDCFIFSKSIGGNEFNQNFRNDFTTGDITLLTDGKSRNSEPTWSNKGDRVAYTSTRRNGADTDIYVESPLDLKTDRMLAEVKGGGWNVQDWSPDGKAITRARGNIDQRKLCLAVQRGDGREERTNSETGGGRGESFLFAGAVRQRWQGRFCHDRPRIGISTACLCRILPAASTLISCPTSSSTWTIGT